MFGKILYIGENIVKLENVAKSAEVSDLMNLHVIFESSDQAILGEISELNHNQIIVRLLGEFSNGKYIAGVLRKPKIDSKVRIISGIELNELVGQDDGESLILGNHAMYQGFKVYPKLNSFFGNHVAIFGNSGSGKSYGVARIVQNIFYNNSFDSSNANILIFDSFGEYKHAFKKINDTNKYNYKFITTQLEESDDYLLKIPTNLLTLDDFALLLQANEHSQLPIIERTLKLTKVFADRNDETIRYKNHLIAKALIAILFSNNTIQTKKNDVFRIIEVCHTDEFNFNTVINGVGYSRTFSECFEIDSNGNFGESVLITDYILKHINDNLESTSEPKGVTYTLGDYADALEFTLISEGFQSNTALHDSAMILKVRLNTIINSDNNKFFTKESFTLDEYIKHLKSYKDNKEAQIININLEDLDDNLAKVIVKIISKMIFTYAKNHEKRAEQPFHLFLEEAHRYIQEDSDTFLIGYNIFDRIAKEGRKYGVLLDIITQRPVEISDTVVAQCSNFLIFKMTHPKDIKYIEEMLPNISSDIIEKQKSLQPGTCVGFGTAFKIPMIVKLDLPVPEPHSSSSDIKTTWKKS